MLNKITLTKQVELSRCDHKIRLSLPDVFAMFMDAATVHADDINVGAAEMMKKGLFWLTVRTSVKFSERPKLGDVIEVSTWPEEPGMVRCCRDYTIAKNGKVIVEGKTEWAVIDVKTSRPYPTGKIYPEGLEICGDRVSIGDFPRISEDFTDCPKLGEYSVRSTDIDLGGHMNNVAYIRAMLGMFSTAELDEMIVSGATAVFRAPCFECERLNVYVRNENGGTEIGAFKEDSKTAFLMRIE